MCAEIVQGDQQQAEQEGEQEGDATVAPRTKRR
jgi:hypothetical protein